MTRQDFVNVVIKKQSIKKVIVLNYISYIVAILCFLLIRFMIQDESFFKNIVDDLFSFSFCIIIAEVTTIIYWMIFAYKKEKEKFNNNIIKDIIV